MGIFKDFLPKDLKEYQEVFLPCYKTIFCLDRKQLMIVFQLNSLLKKYYTYNQQYEFIKQSKLP